MIDEHVREKMREVLADIQGGAFAREWIADMDNGEPDLERAAGGGRASGSSSRSGRSSRSLMTRERRPGSRVSVDVPVALLGYGTVGAAVHRLLDESGDEIERATGHRLRVVRALVRDSTRSGSSRRPTGVLTTTSPTSSTTPRSRSSPR